LFWISLQLDSLYTTAMKRYYATSDNSHVTFSPQIGALIADRAKHIECIPMSSYTGVIHF